MIKFFMAMLVLFPMSAFAEDVDFFGISKPTKSKLYYPEQELEDNVQGKVVLKCQMVKREYLWHATNCQEFGTHEKPDFVEYAMAAAYQSTWSTAELAGKDKNNFINSYNFTLGG